MIDCNSFKRTPDLPYNPNTFPFYFNLYNIHFVL